MNTITLLRHADTISRESFRLSHKDKSDIFRPLSKMGKIQSQNIARFAKRHLQFDLLISSPAKRTKQTLKPIKKVFKNTRSLLSEDITPDCGLEGYLKLLRSSSLEQAKHILIVGHQPDLESFAQYLCPHLDSAFPKGVLMRFIAQDENIQNLAGHCTIDFIIPPYLLEGKN